MSLSRRTLLSSVLLVLAACGRSHIGDGGQGSRDLAPEGGAARPGTDGAAGGSPPSMHSGGSGGAGMATGADAAVTPPDGAGAEGMPPPVTNEARAEVADALTQGPVVWIGQLRSFETPTCVPGVPQLESLDFNPDGYFERVVLIAQGDPDTGALAVRITIGEGVPPATPDDLPPLVSDDAFLFCFYQKPTAGFEYTGLEPFLSDDRLRFDVSPNEMWRPWCESREFGCDGPCEEFPYCYCDDGSCEPPFPIELCETATGPTCECENGACWPNLAHRLPVDLVVTPEGLEGVSFVGELRLRRVMP